MSRVIDARGRSCPEPVIMTKNALDEDSRGLKILVDASVSVENITRFAEGQGYKVDVKEDGNEFEVNITKA